MKPVIGLHTFDDAALQRVIESAASRAECSPEEVESLVLDITASLVEAAQGEPVVFSNLGMAFCPDTEPGTPIEEPPRTPRGA